MKASIVNGVMYAFVAAISASAVVFLVALKVREAMGMGPFLGSLVAFPVTWLAGPLMLAAGGNAALMPIFAFSLALAAPPIFVTWMARRSARLDEEERRLESQPSAETRESMGRHAVAQGSMPVARAYPLAPAPNVPGPRPIAPPIPG